MRSRRCNTPACSTLWHNKVKLPAFIGRSARPKNSSSRLAAICRHSAPNCAGLTRAPSSARLAGAMPAASNKGAQSTTRAPGGQRFAHKHHGDAGPFGGRDDGAGAGWRVGWHWPILTGKLSVSGIARHGRLGLQWRALALLTTRSWRGCAAFAVLLLSARLARRAALVW